MKKNRFRECINTKIFEFLSNLEIRYHKFPENL